jgi:hypothetical protein
MARPNQMSGVLVIAGNPAALLHSEFLVMVLALTL